VYKNNRDASLELQQNAQMCISNVTEETLHQIVLTRVEEIECLYCWEWWTFPTLTVTARLFSYINVLLLLTNITRFKKTGCVTFRSPSIPNLTEPVLQGICWSVQVTTYFLVRRLRYSAIWPLVIW